MNTLAQSLSNLANSSPSQGPQIPGDLNVLKRKLFTDDSNTIQHEMAEDETSDLSILISYGTSAALLTV